MRDEGEVYWNREKGEELVDMVREGKRQLEVVKKGKSLGTTREEG
jgi:hypothetical protein